MKIFLIECRTGCSYCSYENHYRGPFESKEDADRRIAFFLLAGVGNNPVASQYSKKGNYDVREYDAEEISNNRVIINDRVFEWSGFVTVNEGGSTPVDDWFTGEF